MIDRSLIPESLITTVRRTNRSPLLTSSTVSFLWREDRRMPFFESDLELIKVATRSDAGTW